MDREPLRFIAEIGVNHNGSVDIAKELIDASLWAGASAVKFQTFDVDSIIVKTAPKATYHIETTGDDQKGSWYELLQSQSLERKDFEVLSKYCETVGIEFISTPYDLFSAKLLKEIGCSTIKIASTDVNNAPLLRAVASFASEVILSTGMCNWGEVLGAMRILHDSQLKKITILQCTSNYPVPIEEANISVLSGYRALFGDSASLGFSDHVRSDVPAIMALALGARTFEKHITLDVNMPGPDHRSSLEPSEFKAYVDRLTQGDLALGDGEKKVMACEVENKVKLQKFVVANKDLRVGDKIDQDTFGLKRNGGLGLAAGFWDEIAGKKIVRDIKAGDPLNWKDINL